MASDGGDKEAKKELKKYKDCCTVKWIEIIKKARIEIYIGKAIIGDAKAQYWYGVSLQGFTGQQDESLRILKASAEQGFTEAMVAIGLGYSEAVNQLYQVYGVDEEEEYRWYKKAAEAGNTTAQIYVADQRKCENNYESAFYWYSKAANNNSFKGYLGMADCFEAKVRQLLDNEYEKRDKKAILDLQKKMGNCYYQAEKCMDNAEEAEEVYRKLGYLYESMSFNLDNQQEKIKLLKRAIYYFVYAYRNSGQTAEHLLDNVKDISNKYGISVNYSNLDELLG